MKSVLQHPRTLAMPLRTHIVLIGACLLAGIAQGADPQTPSERQQTFAKQVAPLLVRLCYDCHGNGESEGDLSLEPLATADAVKQAPQLAALIAQKLTLKAMPPAEAPQPTDEERAFLAKWIHQTATSLDCVQEARPGRVTLRRLNRFEYRNTVRDLFGVNYEPAVQFPADDVGYGFDHIGDVLSLPPVLMDKYFEAAGIISPQVVVSPASDRFLVKRLRGEAFATGPVAKYAHGGQMLTSNGTMSTNVAFPQRGQYELAIFAFGHQAANEPVQMGIEFKGARIATLPVAATEAAPQLFRQLVQTEAGDHALGFSFLNDYYKPTADRNLIVHRVEIRGPLPDRATLAKEEQAADAATVLIRRLATLAFRRPTTQPEEQRLRKLYQLARQHGNSFEEAVQFTLQGILVSPHFLYRVEPDPPEGQPARRLNQFELATRLSYFLWSSAPDEILFTLARKQVLHLPGVLEGQVLRMLQDEKAEALVKNFAGQWLNLRKLAEIEPDRKQFPDFDDALRAAMVRETELFFTEVMRRDRNVLDLLDADFTYVNPRLARHYGMPAVEAEGFRRVALASGRRAGVLTHASILTLTSNPTRTSPVKRGKWILENILGTPPPDPPPGVEALVEGDQAEATGSLRQRMVAHRADPLCASCHQLMDPIGFGFENFDAIGAWREQDGDFPVDAGGTLPNGQAFGKPHELAHLLRTSRGEQFCRCLSEKMLTYALGRGLEYYDRCAVDEITKALAAGDYRFSRLILAVAQTAAFQYRESR
ncbi:MAG: DUF1592 domain-containing protein [Planctomycetota bacterium]|nr:DUF1592 domain-containing protein [Planctomycetota bacterium]